MQNVEQRYQHDFNEHERTRIENDRHLLKNLDAIAQGKDIEALERFAKGYLGMFLDLDNTIPPQQRISILANPRLAKAIREGFKTVLLDDRFPAPERIADSMLDDDPIPEGYILLAGLDLFADDSHFQISRLPEPTIIAAVCFHYAYKTEMQDQWLSHAITERQPAVAQALTSFWQRLAIRGTDHLPGLYQIIQDQANDPITSHVVLPILSAWKNCRKSTLRDLLQAAIRVADHKPLLAVSENALEEWNPAEPARYILWLATAFVLSPHQYDMVLSDYTGRSKEKIIPLLDFISIILHTKGGEPIRMSADTLAQVLRIVAPKITPQEDRYGEICDNTRKVMYLFYRLATTEDPDSESAIKRLKMVRVMKLYKAILDYVDTVNKTVPDAQPTFNDFIQHLIKGNKIRARIKWSD